MAGINEDRDRQVVPLWRSFESTSHQGELSSLQPVSGRFTDDMLSDLAADWKTEKNLFIASDFVSAALTLGRFGLAADAAGFILASAAASESARGVASLYLAEGKPGGAGDAASSEVVEAGHIEDPIATRLHSEVRLTRAQLVVYPRNPILWSNLARLYTSLGVRDKAARAMKVALSISPENRFILRAASRFYLHEGMKDRAHRLLAGSASVRTDPWVLSAEIATAASMGRTSRHIRSARKILEDKKLSPFHLSELASAVGTLESVSGNLRGARPLIAFSLQDPSENSVAQAAWLRRHIGVGVEKGDTKSSEANAWYAWRAARWTQALRETWRWLAEQPFSSRPAILGSHIASTLLDDQERAVTFAKQGLLGNPGDFSLWNNLAFALALKGDTAGARRAIGEIDGARLNEQDRVVFLATCGLVDFRAGDPSSGRALYRSAISLGQRLGDWRAAVARIYYAFEELQIGAEEAEAVRKEALDASTALTEPWQLALVEKLKRF